MVYIFEAEEMHIVPATRLDFVSGPKMWGWHRTERATVSDRLRWWMKLRLRHDHSTKMQLFLGKNIWIFLLHQNIVSL